MRRPCSLLIVLIAIVLSACQMLNPSSIEVKGVDLSRLSDGVYLGSYECFPVRVSVVVTIYEHTILAIEIVEHRTGQGGDAERIVADVLRNQTLAVDAVSGATLSSKCILKAVETALSR